MQRKFFKLFFSLIMFFGSFHLFAGLEEHFKKITDEKKCTTIRNIDFIYVINIDERPEKFATTCESLQPYNIIPYRFSAVNGWKLSLEEVNNIGVKLEPGMETGFWGTYYLIKDQGKEKHEIIHEIGKNYFSHCMSFGAMGCVLSHLSVLQDAYDSGYETIWVLEDDIEIVQDPRILSTLIDKLDHATGQKGWDIFFTDQDTRDGKGNHVKCCGYAKRPNFRPFHNGIFLINNNVTPYFRKIGARYGTYSMIIRRSGMKKILDFFKTYQIFLPYDMEISQAPGIRMYTVQEDIIRSLIDSISDNGVPRFVKNKILTPKEELLKN